MMKKTTDIPQKMVVSLHLSLQIQESTASKEETRMTLMKMNLKDFDS
jgi:hypothetical protein